MALTKVEGLPQGWYKACAPGSEYGNMFHISFVCGMEYEGNDTRVLMWSGHRLYIQATIDEVIQAIKAANDDRVGVSSVPSTIPFGMDL